MVGQIVSKANALGHRAARLDVSWQSVLLAVLLVAVVVSALGVIYSAFLYRQAFNDQQQLYQQRDSLGVEWGQLLIEQSALASHSRIENTVTKRLDMYVPAPDEIVVVR
ncbi:MAG: cell division protein FtsL [Motiliproteus sp.]